MSPITICCPQCNSSLTFAPKGPAIIKGKCPKCKADLEVTVDAPAETAITESPEPVRPAVPRPPSSSAASRSGKSTAALPSGKSSAMGWLAVGGVVIALVALLSIGCVGLGIWGYLASREKGQDVAVGPKDGLGDKVVNGDEPADGGKKWPNPAPFDKQPNDDNGPITFERGHRLNKDEWAGRERIIPFGAVASRERLEEIKLVQVKGKIKFTAVPSVNDVVITWESLKRVHYDERFQFGLGSEMLLIRGHGGRGKGEHFALEGRWPWLLPKLQLRHDSEQSDPSDGRGV